MPHRVHKRVLAFDVTSKGIGFALLEGPDRLVDWGVNQPRPYSAEPCVRHVCRLIKRYQPRAVIVEDGTKKPRQPSLRVRALTAQIAAVCRQANVPVRSVGWPKVSRTFVPRGRITKHDITRTIARLHPALVARLPPKRKPWMSEDYRMSIFDAVALALAYYHSCHPFRNRIPHFDENSHPHSRP